MSLTPPKKPSGWVSNMTVSDHVAVVLTGPDGKIKQEVKGDQK